ncbi:hypothetical protein LCGC14_1994140 [marine sediment metagenome]|uniref:Uncharacterized protein n=1 Tax=marine sediment metagenome TaxID=412755 RepID=A0A0F9HIK1_9ZZZZ
MGEPIISFRQEDLLLHLLMDLQKEQPWACSSCREALKEETGWKPLIRFIVAEAGAYCAVIAVLCGPCSIIELSRKGPEE